MRRKYPRPASEVSRKGIPRPPGVAKRKKRGLRFTNPKYGKAVKRPGFDSFTVTQVIEDDNGNMTEKPEVVAPESGIHSLVWSLNIVPQPGTFLTLPYEIRQKIYTFCLLVHSMPHPVIRPQKNGKKFISTANPIVLPIYINLSLISRQTYVDVVGGGILYSISRFTFNSSTLMINYLLCINPAHKALIRSLTLRVRITTNQKNIPKKAFTTLASLTALQSLEIELSVDFDVCNCAKGGREYIMGMTYLKRIQDNKNWELLKGLRKFKLSFTGWDSHHRYAQFLWSGERYDAAQEIIRQKLLHS